MTLMTTPPSQTPHEVVAEIERGRFAAVRTAGWAGLAGCLSMLVYLLVSSISMIFATSAYMIAVRRSLDEAQRTVLVQSWQLRHLVPRAARAERDT